MSSVTQRVVLSKIWQPLVQSVRHGRRVNLQRPRPPHYERALLEALVKPVYLKPVEMLLPLSRKCLKKEETDISNFKYDNQYENILAKQLFTLFDESRMVAICQKNAIKADDRFNMYIRFKREGMTIKEHGRHTLKIAVQNTKYEPILQLFTVHQLMIFSPEPNVSTLLKTLKKTPELVLLAGIVDGYLASVTQLNEYVRLKDITAARSELVSILNAGTQSLVSNLSQQQSILVNQLDQIVDMRQKETKPDSSVNKEKSQSEDQSTPSESS